MEEVKEFHNTFLEKNHHDTDAKDAITGGMYIIVSWDAFKILIVFEIVSVAILSSIIPMLKVFTTLFVEIHSLNMFK